MDFLDPKKEHRNRLTLLLGYCLIALAIVIATLVLLFSSIGFHVNRKGEVTQNGLLFVASQPSGSAIYLNGQRYRSNTDTRILTPAGQYKLEISRTGYRSWVHQISVSGGAVERFVYPFLFPSQLAPTSLADTTSLPNLGSQSLDRRWLLVSQSETPGSFTLYDFKTPARPVAKPLELPATLYADSTGAQSWSEVEWSSDNLHVLLLHTYQAVGVTKHEYIVVNRDIVTDSVNVTDSLKLNQTDVPSLFNNRVQQYFIFDTASHTLSRVNAADGTQVSQLTNILAFKSYADNKLLYVTDVSPTGKSQPGKVSVVMQDGQKTVTLRTLPAGAANYQLNLAQYGGNWYVTVASTEEPTVYIYQNPQAGPADAVDAFPAPWRRLSLSRPSYLSFSANTQYLLAESGQDFVVYDFEHFTSYHYHVNNVLDQPQQHAGWMDGNRLQYISAGKLIVFDFDNTNLQTLVAMSPTAEPFYAPDYTYLYGLRDIDSSDSASKPGISSTSLRVLP